MKLLNLLVISFLTITLFVACGGPQEGVGLLSCKEFDEKVKATENVQLIDVRTPGEFEGGTIGTALNIDYKSDNFQIELGKLNKELPIFVFCARGGRSAGAAGICKELGFKEIYDLDGGYTAWESYEK